MFKEMINLLLNQNRIAFLKKHIPTVQVFLYSFFLGYIVTIGIILSL